MSRTHQFQRGDVVVHPRRPEWGQGKVQQATQTMHQGTPAQRVTVQFANKGRVVINTAVAPLSPHNQSEEEMTQTRSDSSSSGWLGQLERATNNNTHELWSLPEAMTDPFLGIGRRLQATLESYRFTTEPRSLIDWAVAQTGLNDPLSKYTRSELEQAFPRFARDRDQHLQQLVRQIKRGGDTQMLQDALHKTRVPAAKTALEKAMRR